MKQPDDRVFLFDMLEHSRLAVEATSGRSREDVERDFILAAALERFVEVVGEAASKTSSDLRQRLPRVSWREMIGMRNLLIHGYSSVDRSVIWNVVTVDMPTLIAMLEEFLSSEQ